MSRSLFTAVSALRNHQAWLDVIGNNIANANTTGYKASSVVFSDVLSQTLNAGTAPGASTGGINPSQIGLGSKLSSITMNFQQGTIQNTNRTTDLAIEGEGFFVLANGNDRVYSRAGSFSLDATGTLVDSASGFLVQGAGGNIRINLGQQTPATPTGEAFFKGNLDSTRPDGATYVATFDIRDSLGSSHTLTITFTKNFAAAAGQWDWAVTEADPAITSLTTATGSVTFGPTGAISAGASQAIGVVYAAAAGVATPQAVTLDFGTASNPIPVTGFASASTVTLGSQDGRASGTLQSFTVGQDGVISGFYSNGTTATIDTLRLAAFPNPTGLLKAGSNRYRESPASGTASIGNPSVGGLGTILGGGLEQSNVDLAAEFSALIIAQRGFQANARTIATVDSMLEELVNLKR
jgi:flagellar hook protein FlgE